ncbi:Transcriptional regulator, MarR family [Candidatus Rhodobacter oscarellae]|uniref:Transcriptional regulator, MarR family n=1 Tax=Candidatus Rhodobacter oscarellae TaxID=1675527 RepID=A0A0J9ECK7_9RHOB|nr:MarR family transcriptional regulator [Candidatus Rhodobacter lobularis]KMW60512.1 Transcriptional regulator, MarR family [Candidatus Rhodobacter lobularis]
MAAFEALGQQVTPEEWTTLAQMQANPGMTLRALAERLGRDPTTVTRMIDRLVRKGLAERRADRKDRRAVRLFLSRHGYETFAQLAPIAEGVAARAAQAVPKAAQEEVATALRAVLAQLDAEQP